MTAAAAKITSHMCLATAEDLARVFRDLATAMEDNPKSVLIGLWTSVSTDNDLELEVQVVWDDYESSTPSFDG